MYRRHYPEEHSPVLMQAGWVTWTVLILSLVVTLSTWVGTNNLTNWLRWSAHDIAAGQWWRTITPAFLHFKSFDSLVTHFLFNALWWLTLGGLIETREGPLRLILLFLFAAVIGNTTGGYFYGSYFGGLSGVCFALIGYVWLRGYQIAAYRAVVKPGLFYASVVFMLAGFVHLISGMADWVHAAGLATGLLIALPYYLITTRWPQHQEQE